MLWDIFAVLIWIGFIRYVLLGKFTTEEISTYIKNGTMRTISIMGALMLISFFMWLMYTAFTSDYESDVCFFITSDDCN